MFNKTKDDIVDSLNEQLDIIKKHNPKGFTKEKIRDTEMFNRGYVSAYIDEGILGFNDLNDILLKIKTNGLNKEYFDIKSVPSFSTSRLPKHIRKKMKKQLFLNK